MNFTTIFLLFVLISLLYEIKKESSIKRKTEGTLSDRWSYYVMAISYIILLIGTVVEYFVVKRDINFILSSLGVLMYISGHLLRNWSIRTLGECWSLHIEIKENHKLLKEGPYKYLRHPNYLATLFKGIGFTLIPNSFYTFLYALVIFIPIRLIRIYLEEKELIKKFGNEYLRYKEEVFALLPLKKPVKTRKLEVE